MMEAIVTYRIGSDDVELEHQSSELMPPRQDEDTRRCTETKRFTKSTKARQHWKILRKHVDQSTDGRRESIRDKWVNMTRSLSHEVTDFFVTANHEPGEELADQWLARSQRLHKRSLLIRNKRSQDSTTPFSPIALLNIYGEDEDEDQIEATASGWVCKSPTGRLSAHSRQQSRISAGSSRRMTRMRPSLKIQKDSVFKMAVDRIKSVTKMSSYTDSPQRIQSATRNRSIAPASFAAASALSAMDTEEYIDGLFFDLACPTSSLPIELETTTKRDSPVEDDYSCYSSFDTIDLPKDSRTFSFDPASSVPQQDHDILRHRQPSPARPTQPPAATRRAGPSEPQGGGFMRRLPNEMIDTVGANNDRRHFGIGVVGDLLGTDYRQSILNSEITSQMLQLQDYRPFFTYWVTFVQIVVFIFTIAVYDVINFSETDIQDYVKDVYLSSKHMSYTDPGNMWIGPSQADLIRLGAKYSPCMRLDENVKALTDKDLEIEKQSGCCIGNDGSGCVQTVDGMCHKSIRTWYNGTVCGQNKSYCADLYPTDWDEDITKWPICKQPREIDRNAPREMTCMITGRPCCVGIFGQCIITTEEYCRFRNGYFHPEASLCSQVKSCLNEVCGMLPFHTPGRPSQFFRLWISLFLHAGVVPLVITVALQFLVMRDLEKLLGWLRIGCIYIVSGIAGSLASAIFLPYHVEAGPSGSQFALLACLIVEVIQNWKILDSPWVAIGKFSLILVVLFVVGLFPWVDNYAHLFGFIFGFLISFAVMPYVNFNILTRRGKLISTIICLTMVLIIFIVLVILFYVHPIYKCSFCHHFNCIDFTRKFCDSLKVEAIAFEP